MLTYCVVRVNRPKSQCLWYCRLCWWYYCSILICIINDILTFSLTRHHNITFELYINNIQMQTMDEAVISGPCWSASDQYGLLIMVSWVGGDFTVKPHFIVALKHQWQDNSRRWGTMPDSDQWTSVTILKWTSWHTSNQCRWQSTGVMWCEGRVYQ